MSTHQCILEIANKDEWLQHIANVASSGHTQNSEELLDALFAFDFKFDTTIQ